VGKNPARHWLDSAIQESCAAKLQNTVQKCKIPNCVPPDSRADLENKVFSRASADIIRAFLRKNSACLTNNRAKIGRRFLPVSLNARRRLKPIRLTWPRYSFSREIAKVRKTPPLGFAHV
jgi:hypothetical protein